MNDTSIFDLNDPANRKLISHAKTLLPNPDNYPSKYCCPPLFNYDRRVIFKRVAVPSVGFKWEVNEIKAAIKYTPKNYDTLY